MEKKEMEKKTQRRLGDIEKFIVARSPVCLLKCGFLGRCGRVLLECAIAKGASVGFFESGSSLVSGRTRFERVLESRP